VIPKTHIAAHLAALAVLCSVARAGIDGASPLKKSKVLVDEKTRVYLTFDKLENGRIANTAEKFKTHPAKIQGAVALTDGLFGKAVRTTGDGAVVVPGSILVGLTRPSIEFWIRPGARFPRTTLLELTDEDGRVIWKLTLLAADEGARLHFTIRLNDDTTRTIASFNGLNQPDRWYRILVLKHEWGVRIYRDGYPVGEEPFRIHPPKTAGRLLIRTPPAGAIDDLAVGYCSRSAVHPDIADLKLAARNLDFESKAAGWVGVYDDPVIDDAVKHGGAYSLRIETDDTYNREYLSPMFSVEPGATYRVAFWARVDRFEKGYASLGVWIRWYFAPEETCSFGGDLVAHCLWDHKERTFGWRKFSAEIPVWDEECFFRKIRWARIQVKNHHSLVRAWVDDITVEKISDANDKGKKGDGK